jgi:PAS domain S-box-containing protein
MTEQHGMMGVLVVDEGGTIVFSSGVMSRAAVATAVIQRWRRAEDALGALWSVRSGDMSLCVLATQADQACAFFALSDGCNDELLNFVNAVPFAGDILRHLLTSPYEAMTVVDSAGVVRYLSPVHEKFFGMERADWIGKHVTKVIENTRLDTVVRTGKAEIGQTQEMRGATRIVSRVPIRARGGELVGAVGQVMFRGPEHLQSMNAELSQLRTEVAFYRRELTNRRTNSLGLEQIVGNSAVIRKLKDDIVKVAPLDVPVLLVGESGTGKELVAHALHLLSMRRDNPLVLVNAAALPATLVESELFGYEAGAFTGAERKGRKGKFEQANEGTLFFDEIGDMPLEIQVKLLRVLQDGAFERVGSERSRSSNFRLISASNVDFQRMIAEKSFRLDLFYRISGVTLHVPSLRERRDDIPLLVEHALENFAQRHGTAKKRVSAAAMELLVRQPWPGNVRQLIHTLERGVIFAEGEEIGPGDLGLLGEGEHGGSAVASLLAPRGPGGPGERPLPSVASTISTGPVREAVSSLEMSLIRDGMARFKGNKLRVASELGISRSYLYKRLAEMGPL